MEARLTELGLPDSSSCDVGNGIIDFGHGSRGLRHGLRSTQTYRTERDERRNE